METQCSICSGPLIYAHLGINACRACAVFYKRTLKSKTPLRCKGAERDCMESDPRSNCRMCRFNKMKKVLENAAEGCPEPFDSEGNVDALRKSSDSSAVDNFERQAGDQGATLLERLRVQYRLMSHTRLIAELHARGDVPHPLRIRAKPPPVFSATLKSVQPGNKIFLSSALEFGCLAFPEFEQLEKRAQWDIITEFFYGFKMFEGCYRANAIFPEHPERYLQSFTTYVSPEIFIAYEKDLPPGADSLGALKYITSCKYLSENVVSGRELIARLSPSQEEFLAVVGLMFWSIGDIPFCQESSDLAEKYTKQIMSELHAYYREKLKLEDYAARLGELLMFLQVFDVKDQFKEHIEMLRLLNVYDDDTFVFRLQRE